MNDFKHLKIEFVPIDSIFPNPRNARTHSPKQISQVRNSIKRFGWLVPLVIDEKNMIAAGHCRWECAKQMKLTEVPVIRASFMTDADRRAFALAENQLATLAGWDDDILQAELKGLFEEGYELEITGFSVGDLNIAAVPDGAPKDSEIPPLPLNPVSRVGDLWLIGGHRLYCGDARDVVSWETAMGDDRATLVFGDLPFNVPITGHVSGNGRNKHREFVMGAGEMSPSEFITFQRAIYRNCVRFSVSGSIHYLCMDWRHMREIFDAADGVYTQFKQLIVWVKDNGGQGAFYRSRHELIFVFKSGTAKHQNHFGLGGTGRYRTNVVEYAGCNTFRKGRDADLAAHSTTKPLAMVMDFLLDCSTQGDVVADPTAGSGTTLLAAHYTKRRGAAIELDPGYVDTALTRLRAATGIEPILAGDGRGFDAIASERLGGEG